MPADDFLRVVELQQAVHAYEPETALLFESLSVSGALFAAKGRDTTA
jgi:hypothetical protein